MNSFSVWRLACRACVNRSAQSQSWHTFEATHSGSATLSGMISKGSGKQSKRYECQLLHKANTVWRNPGMTTDDVCLMFTWALKIVPGFQIHVGNKTRERQMHAVLVLFRPLPNVGIQNFGMWGKYNFAKAYRSIQLSIANRRVEDWETSNGHTKDTTRLFHGPLHDPVGEHICAQPFRMWNRLRFYPLFAGVTNISKTQKRCK